MSYDSDVSQDMRALKEYRKQLKDDAEKINMLLLDKHKDRFTSKKLTQYCVRIWANGKEADFWPRTGKWIAYRPKLRGESFESLLNILESQS